MQSRVLRAALELRRWRSAVLDYFPPPSFALSTLSVSHSKLTPSLYKWFFASSVQMVEFLEVHTVVGASLRGTCLRTLEVELYITSEVDNVLDDETIIAGLSGFTGLRTRHIDLWGRVNFWVPMYNHRWRHSFTILDICNVASMLESNWQPSLRSADVYMWTPSNRSRAPS
ncbi:hypothetical protein EDB19DRAFT_121900 [Suillus lakei]|nr:hypothetical protein EDB19DRAFT_121900 [Suillus lakei]